MDRSRAIIVILATFVISVCAQSLNYDLKEIEFVGGDKILATNDQTNYAIVSNNFPQGWLAASVNGQDVIIVGNDGRSIDKTISSLTDAERQALVSIKSRFDPVLVNMDRNRDGIMRWNWNWNINNNYDNFKPNGLLRTVFYSRNGGSTSIGGNTNQNNYNHMGNSGESYSFSESNGDFTLTSPNLPYNWSRVLVQGSLVTTVTRDGGIYTRSLSGLTADEQQQVNSIKGAIYQEVLQSQQEREKRQQERELYQQQKEREREVRDQEREQDRLQKEKERELRQQERERDRLQKEKERELREQERERDRLQKEKERELREQEREQDRIQREKERELREQERLQRERERELRHQQREQDRLQKEAERELRQQQRQQARRQW